MLVLGGLRAVSQTILLVISPGASKLEHGSEWVPSDNLWKEAGKERESKTSKHSVMRLEKIYESITGQQNEVLKDE